MIVFNSSKFFFLIFIVLIVKGQEETSKHDSIDSFVSNSDILTKLKSYDELVRSLEIKLIDLELEVKEKSAEIDACLDGDRVLIVFVKVVHYSGVWYLVFAKVVQMRIVELWHQVDFYCSEPAV